MNSPAISPNALPSSPSTRSPGRLVTSILGRALLCGWAGFWTWFCFSVALSEGGRSWLFGGVVIVAALGVAAAALIRPVIGGWLAIAAGVVSVFVFRGADAILLMALPPMVAGLLAIIGGSGRVGSAPPSIGAG